MAMRGQRLCCFTEGREPLATWHRWLGRSPGTSGFSSPSENKDEDFSALRKIITTARRC